ncbi:MAG: branched-chain amino acid ABC transporter permease [Clostridiaceae bacterium]|jgi:branched-chain amino acid transport system permease protein|nr:branched-chain amino acid ABC transporter permease [Clostridiaceae bacterium]
MSVLSHKSPQGNALSVISIKKSEAYFSFANKWSTVVILVGILAIIGSFIWWLNMPLIEDMFTSSTITLIMVLGFQLYMGNSGILNWSYVGYIGIGAFASAIFSMDPDVKALQLPTMYPFLVDLHLPFPLALIGGALFATLIAAIVAWPLMRLSDSVGAITQFALLIVFNVILSQWSEVTNGPRTFTLGHSRQTTLWAALVVAIFVIAAVYYYKESSLGLKLRATRDDRYAARSSGINLVATRYVGYVISAFIGGFAGGLFSHYILSITAASFYMQELFVVLSMLVIGGTMSVSGAFFGTLVVTLARQGLRQVELGLTKSGFEASGTTEIVLAIFMIIFLIWRPRGITGGSELSWSSITKLCRRVFRRGSN